MLFFPFIDFFHSKLNLNFTNQLKIIFFKKLFSQTSLPFAVMFRWMELSIYGLLCLSVSCQMSPILHSYDNLVLWYLEFCDRDYFDWNRNSRENKLWVWMVCSTGCSNLTSRVETRIIFILVLFTLWAENYNLYQLPFCSAHLFVCN